MKANEARPDLIPLHLIPGGQPVTEIPGTKNKVIGLGSHAEGQIKAGQILVTLSLLADGSYGIEYYPEKAGIAFLRESVDAPETGTKK
jgi:hypothetical protein